MIVIIQNEILTIQNQILKKFFSNNYIVDIFMFILAIILLLAITLTMYLLCKHKKLRVLIASLVLQQVKYVGTESQHTNFE